MSDNESSDSDISHVSYSSMEFNLLTHEDRSRFREASQRGQNELDEAEDELDRAILNRITDPSSEETAWSLSNAYETRDLRRRIRQNALRAARGIIRMSPQSRRELAARRAMFINVSHDGARSHLRRQVFTNFHDAMLFRQQVGGSVLFENGEIYWESTPPLQRILFFTFVNEETARNFQIRMREWRGIHGAIFPHSNRRSGVWVWMRTDRVAPAA